MAQRDATGTVIVIHGLGANRLAMWPLAARLRRCGFPTVTYGFRDLLAPLRDNARALAAFCRGLPGPRLHFVGHSLGGLLVLRLLADCPDPRSGRAVLLGTPCQGSRVAERFARVPALRRLLGRSVREGLLADRPEWRGGAEVGVIAGSRPLGIGTLTVGLPSPNDGLIAVEETRLPGAPQLVLRVSHTEMLFSGAVARAACAFLRTGAFREQA